MYIASMSILGHYCFSTRPNAATEGCSYSRKKDLLIEGAPLRGLVPPRNEGIVHKLRIFSPTHNFHLCEQEKISL